MANIGEGPPDFPPPRDTFQAKLRPAGLKRTIFEAGYCYYLSNWMSAHSPPPRFTVYFMI